jgi:hypothetical protein
MNEKKNKIKHHIRNFNELTPRMIEEIMDFTDSEKMELIITYNSTLMLIRDLLETVMKLND